MNDWTKSQLERKKLAEQGITVVASMRKGKDSALLAWAKKHGLYKRIDRQSEWGNPFLIPSDGDRGEVCDKHIDYLSDNPSLLKKIDTLKVKVLVCWCHPERCHGDHLAELANSQEELPK